MVPPTAQARPVLWELTQARPRGATPGLQTLTFWTLPNFAAEVLARPPPQPPTSRLLLRGSPQPLFKTLNVSHASLSARHSESAAKALQWLVLCGG